MSKKKTKAETWISVKNIYYTTEKTIPLSMSKKLRVKYHNCVADDKKWRRQNVLKVWADEKTAGKYWVYSADNYDLFVLKAVCKTLEKNLDIGVIILKQSAKFWKLRNKCGLGRHLDATDWDTIDDGSSDDDAVGKKDSERMQNRSSCFWNFIRVVIWLIVMFVVVNILFSTSEFRVPSMKKCLKSRYQHKESGQNRCVNECGCSGTRMCSIWGYCHAPTESQSCALFLSLDQRALLFEKTPSCKDYDTINNDKYYFSGNVSLW